MSEFFKTFGPWGLVLLAMAVMLKYLVTDKLKTILAKLAKVDEHEVKLERISTAMEMHGSGKWSISYWIGLAASARVWPVFTDTSLASAPMSPAISLGVVVCFLPRRI